MERANASLCIIVRNDAVGIQRLISEARPWLEEIVVVDTGSDDDSPETARRAGADVVSCRPDLIHDDGVLRSFADARNASFALATKPWRLWLDTDDTLGEQWPRMRDLISRLKLGQALDFMYDYAWSEDRTQCTLAMVRTRVIHVDDEWTWTRPLHEYLKTSREHSIVRDDELHVIHLTSNSRSLVGDRNLKILQRWELDGGLEEDPVALNYYMGSELFARGDYEAAFERFDRMAGTDTNMRFSGSLRAARSLLLQGRCIDALHYLKRCYVAKPGVANTYWDIAMVHRTLGNYDTARLVFEESLKAPVQIDGETIRPKNEIAQWLTTLSC